MDANSRLTREEAIAAIERIARELPGGTIRHDGLGYRREGVPGTGGGTFAVSYTAGERNRADGRNYMQIGYC